MTRTTISNGSNAMIDEKVAEIVATLLPEKMRSTRIAYDESLTNAGLNSLAMVNLLLEIEASFNVTMAARLVTPKSFRSIHSISRLIESITLAT